ncbi:MAG: hypothetical protein IJW21_04330, partial [Clostridia bacterium]|nr:hypothetical protein [Clostridia bacterium]
NGKAIAVNNHKNMMNAFLVTLPPAIILSCFAVIFAPVALIPIWIMPAMFFSFSWLVFLFEKYDESEFLRGQKKKHEFTVENGTIYKNGKERKNIRKMSLYKYKRYLLLVLDGGEFYLIPDNAYTAGSRAELLASVRFTGIHTFVFKHEE